VTRDLILGTRGSPLAIAQSQWFARLLTASTGRGVQLVTITTTGDVTEGSVAALGGTGVFATALREALLGGDCDFIVHSLKDLPTADFPGLSIAAIPMRERANDTLCSRERKTLRELPAGARVGTGSPRRAAQVRHARPDLQVADIRGNVDTRLAKVARGEYDAVVLASAGLRRIGRADDGSEEFDLTAWPTSAGQGALAVECRTGSADDALRALLGALTDTESFVTSSLEREVLRRLEAGCSAPVGISTRVEGSTAELIAEVYGQTSGESIHVTRALALDGMTRRDHRELVAKSVVGEFIDRGLSGIAPMGPGTGARS